MKQFDVSIIITTYNDGHYLDMLLNDIRGQIINNISIEILLVDAGDYGLSRALDNLGPMSKKLKYISMPNISRTEALNKLVSLSKGDLLVRLDARSHIGVDYVSKILNLSNSTGASNVGGIMLPVGRNDDQQLIADIMKHPASFGRGKSRRVKYKGVADSVYLGAFRKALLFSDQEWFDSMHPRISEDSDLNYRIIKDGGSIYINSDIVVEYFPRENIMGFLNLCFNYGVGRGLFIIKNRAVSAFRQIVPPILFILMASILYIGHNNNVAMVSFLCIIMLYIVIIYYSAIYVGSGMYGHLKAMVCFIGCHFLWVAGLIVAPFFYMMDLVRVRRE